MSNSITNKLPGAWKQDFLASIVVFFVALPLCMGVALASGAPIATGLITGIVGGLVAGSLAGCPLQVSGPAAGLTVIVYEVIQRLGLEMLGIVVLLAGVIQIVAGALRLGPWFRAVSPAVINGMLAGIGVLIFASQFHVMVDDKPRGSGLENLATIPQAVYKGVGFPRIAGEKEREYRTHALQAVAELHHDQINLRTHIADLIPYHNIDHEALGLIVEPQLHDLAGQQSEITGGLRELAEALEYVEKESAGAIHLSRAKAALAEARARSREAEDALDSGKAVDAVRTQDAAVAAIDVAASRLKNHRVAASLGILTIAIIMLWQKFAPHKLRLVPGPLLAIVVATLVAAYFLLPVLYVEIPANLADDIHFLKWSLLQTAPWSDLLATALLVAVVASAETLLCATAVDQIATGSRTNYDRELAAQGVGNIVCGCLGALPMTGVIVRSSTNVYAGATSRLSAILHGVWLLLFVAVLAGLLQLIPTASLAAVLVYTGYKLVNIKQIKKLRAAGWGEVGIYLATVVTIVVEDLLTGVLVGVALAAAKLLYTFSHLVVKVERDELDGRFMMHLAGAATFVRLPKLAAALEEIPENAQLHVELDRLTYIDHACLDLFTSWAVQHEQTGGRLSIDWDSLHASFREGPQAAAVNDVEDTWVEHRDPALTR
jgi:MFS superfamily sulfate permease-like transporter